MSCHHRADLGDPPLGCFPREELRIPAVDPFHQEAYPRAPLRKAIRKILLADTAVPPQRLRHIIEHLDAVVVIFLPAVHFESAPGAGFVNGTAVDCIQIGGADFGKLFRDSLHGLRHIPQRLRRVIQLHDDAPAQSVRTRQIRRLHKNPADAIPAARRDQHERYRGERHLIQPGDDGLLTADLQRSDPICQNKRDRCGKLAKRRKQSGHQSAECISARKIAHASG